VLGDVEPWSGRKAGRKAGLEGSETGEACHGEAEGQRQRQKGRGRDRAEVSRDYCMRVWLLVNSMRTISA
jgi:hypothetical protein